MTNTKTKPQPAPTLEQVAQLQTRAVDLEVEAEQLGEREEDLTKEIEAIHVAGGGGNNKNKKGDVKALTRERRETMDEKADVLAAIATLQRRIDTDRALACTSEAAERMPGIARAYGSLRQELDEDEAAVQAAAVEYKAKGDRVNARFRSLAMLRAEAGALADRFGVPAPTFAPPVVIPAMRKGCGEAAMTVQSVTFLDHSHVATAMEKDEHGIRSRRTFKEISATPGFAIIKSAGWQPWPALTEAQEKILDGRQRDVQAEIVASKRFAAAAERAKRRGGMLGAL